MNKQWINSLQQVLQDDEAIIPLTYEPMEDWQVSTVSQEGKSDL